MLEDKDLWEPHKLYNGLGIIHSWGIWDGKEREKPEGTALLCFSDDRSKPGF